MMTLANWMVSNISHCRLKTTEIPPKIFSRFPANLSADVPSYPAYRPRRYSFSESLAKGCGLPEELFGGIFQVCRNSFVVWRLSGAAQRFRSIGTNAFR